MIFLDLETTGTEKDKDNIIDIAIIKVNDELEIIEKFDTLLQSDVEISSFITNLTGITNDMLINSPRLSDVKEKIIAMCEGEIVCGHNINFDVGFLNEKGITVPTDVIDTYFLAHLVEGDLFSYSQEYIAQSLNIEYVAHRALPDTKANLDIFRKLFDKLKTTPKEKLFEVVNFLKGIPNYHGYMWLFEKAYKENNNKEEIFFTNVSKPIYSRNIDKTIKESHFEIIETSKSNFNDIISQKISKSHGPVLIIANEYLQNTDEISTKKIVYLNETYKYYLQNIVDYLKTLSKLNDPQIRIYIKLIFYIDEYKDLSKKFDIKFVYDETTEIQNLLSKLNMLEISTLPDEIMSEVLYVDIIFTKYDLLLSKNDVLNHFDNILLLNYEEIYNYAIGYYKKKINIHDIKNELNEKSNITKVNTVLNNINNEFNRIVQLQPNDKLYKSIYMYDIGDSSINNMYQQLYDATIEYKDIFKNTHLDILLDILGKKHKYVWIEYNQNKLYINVFTNDPLQNFYNNIENKRLYAISNAIFDKQMDMRLKFNPNIHIIKNEKPLNLYHLTDSVDSNDKQLYYRYIANVIVKTMRYKNNTVIFFNTKQDILDIYELLNTQKSNLDFNFFAQNIHGSTSKHQMYIQKSNSKNVLLALYDNFLLFNNWLDIFDIYIIARLPFDMSYYNYYKLWCRDKSIDHQLFFNQRKILKTKKFFDKVSELKSNIIINADPLLFDYQDENSFIKSQYMNINLYQTILRELQFI